MDKERKEIEMEISKRLIAEVKQRQEKYKEELDEKPLHEQFKEQGIMEGLLLAEEIVKNM